MRAHLVVLALAAMLGAPSLARGDVAWRTGALEPLLAEAQSSHRLVLMDFYADWCGPCQNMDAMVWSRADVGAIASRGFVGLRVDADTTVGAALRERYHVGGLPTVLAVHADGTEIDRLTGENDAATVMEAMQAWQRGESTLPVLERRLAQRPSDNALRLEVGGRYADRGDVTNARRYLDEAVANDPQNAHGQAAQALLALGDRLYLRARHDAAAAIGPLEDLRRRFPQSEAAAAAARPLGTALHRAGRDGEARAVLDQWLAAAPTEAASTRANEVAWMMFREHWDLPRAETIARAGLAHSPRDHALIDTLAEIVFAQARAAEAVQLEEEAARIDPSSAYYRQQVARFRAGMASSAPPAPHARPATRRHP